MQRKLDNSLSMAARARKVIAGTTLVEQAIKQRQAKYLLIATDAAEATKEKIIALARHYDLDYAMVIDGTSLGAIIGKEYRAVLAILDNGFADKIQEYINQVK